MLKNICKILIVLLCIFNLLLPNSCVVIAAALNNENPNSVNKINLTAKEYYEGGEESTGFDGEYDANSYKYIVKSGNTPLSTTVLKIVDVDDEDNYSFDNAFYCINGHDNFPTRNGSLEYARTIADFLEKNPETLGLSDENYNSICWLVNNIYLSKQMSQNERAKYKNELLTKAFKEILEDTSVEPMTELADIKSTITDDDIDFVQQWAIWYFTNHTNGEYDEFDDSNPVNNGYTFQRVPFTNEEINLPMIDLEPELGNADAMRSTRYAWLNILYKYFVNEALNNKEEKFAESELNFPELVNLDPTCTIDGSYYKVGPFKINQGDDNLEYEIKLMDGKNEISAETYEIRIADGTKISGSINTLFNIEYYIYIPVNGNAISNVSLKLAYTKYETRASVWQATDTNITYQPVMLVTKDAEPINEKISVEIAGVFDLALQKYITKLNNSEIKDREPKIQYLNNEITYNSNAQPLNVKVGDKIEYTIFVYNEGDIDGYASEICDDIPNGLIFNADDSTNKMYGWKMYDSEGKATNDTKKAVKIKTTYLSKENSQLEEKDKLIKAFDKESLAFDGKFVKVVFEVGVTDNNATIINTAEITGCSDTDGNPISDRDSTPDNNKPDEDDIDQEKVYVSVYDMNLKKFITKVNGTELENNREPVVDVKPLKDGELNATYTTVKTPEKVKIGDKVTYKIRVYNEGSLDGYAQSVADYLPEGLGYLVEYKPNIENCWNVPGTEIEMTTTTLGDIESGIKNLSISDFSGITDLSKANVVKGKVKLVSNLLEKTSTGENLIRAFDGENIHYKDIEITCVVLSDVGLKNIAEIVSEKDENNEDVVDRDSTPDSVNPDNYPNDDQNQDDHDVEYLTVVDFDLSLQKFITAVNNEKVEDRIPVAEYKDGEFIYKSDKSEPVKVKPGDQIEYTLRVYNEGDVNGYAKEIVDNIPEMLVFDPNNEINKMYGWKMYDKNDNAVAEFKNAKKIKTDYLSKEKSSERNDDALLNTFNKDKPDEISYKDVKVVFTVSSDVTIQIVKNIAEISDDSDEDGNEIDDKDSIPNNDDKNEDDIDDEQITIDGKFDLALVKYISKVNNKEIEGRVPKISYKDGKIIYSHPETPLEVNSGDSVEYTINVYNEGELSGYAKIISDNIPNGLVFDINNAVNKMYGWVMYDKDGIETTDGTKAVEIRTDYLSKEKSQARGKDELIDAFDAKDGKLSYATVKVVFVVSSVSNNERITNIAEIYEDTDKDGEKIDDADSTPNNKDEKEDDLDKEIIHVGFFDLSLKKDLIKAIVTEKDKTTEINGENGKMLKIEIKKKNINSTIVKFLYNISVTNEGTIPGYATGIKDYIPEGFEFVESDNQTNWTKVSDGVIECKALEKEIINPGETKTVQVVLRWKNDENNLGVKKNIAEISADKNDANDVDDTDSTPDNKKEGEDDIDSAEVILSVATGKNKNIILLIVLVCSITVGGVILVRKFVM